MTELKHTPGPWEAHFTHWGEANVTHPCTKEEWDGDLRINGQPHLRVTHYIKPDDAKLIAAAPELLESLRGLLGHAGIADANPEDIDPEDHHLESVARALLARLSQ